MKSVQKIVGNHESPILDIFNWPYINRQLVINDAKELLAEARLLSRDSQEYLDVWRDIYDRCIYGITIGGKYIPGALYFYINFGTIMKLDASGTNKSLSKPDYRDVEDIVFRAFYNATVLKKGLVLVTGRRAGKSFIVSGMEAWTYSCFKDSNSLIITGSKFYLEDHFAKTMGHLDGMAGTELDHRRVASSLSDFIIKSGYKTKNDLGNEVIAGFNSQVKGIIVSNKASSVVGASAKFVAFEEAGMFPLLKATFTAAKPLWMAGKDWFGTPVILGTGGDMEGGGSIDFQQMFYQPDSYNLLSVNLPTDRFQYKQRERNPGKPTGLFLPGYMSFDDSRDKNGDIDHEAASKNLKKMHEEIKLTGDMKAYNDNLQYFPECPEDSFLTSKSSMFPVDLISLEIQRRYSDPLLYNAGQKGTLVYDSNGNVLFEPDLSGNLGEIEYPYNPSSPNKGCVTIYEHPVENAPDYLYIAGADPYMHDASNTSDPSFGSVILFKRRFRLDGKQDEIVAEYSARPETTLEWNETVLKLCKYYNASLMYENMVPLLKQHFEEKGTLKYLAYSPSAVTKQVHPNSKVNRTYGMHATKELRNFCFNKLADWLRTVYAVDEDGTKHYNVEKVNSLGLLQELRDYYSDGNFDRIDAAGMLFGYLAELYYKDLDKKEAEKKEGKKTLNFMSKVIKANTYEHRAS